MQWPSLTKDPHIEGMITLVRLRGGIDGMRENRHIQRVVAWADILHAATHNSLPQLGISQFPGHGEMERLMEAVRQPRRSRASGPNIVPAYFLKISEDLQTLAVTRALLAKKALSSPQVMRPIFSDLLFVTEYRILRLGHTIASPRFVMGDATGVEAVKAAALIFCFHGLRDLALTAAFFDGLIQRLYDALLGVVHEDEALAVPLLLWLCLNGWKASTIKTRQKYREFFAKTAAVLCESAGINSLEGFRSFFLTEYYPPACSGLWADIANGTA